MGGYELELGRTPIQSDRSDMPTQGLIFSTLQTMVSPIFESSFTFSYRNLVQMCLEADPLRRPSSQQLVHERMPSACAADRKLLAQILDREACFYSAFMVGKGTPSFSFPHSTFNRRRAS